MKIAVEGCCHGELDKIYETIAFLENKENVKVDLLICCGDFQAVRNKSDLQCMAVPPKYQKLNTFYKYYSGEKVAPILTLFIGGNHEASNYLQELPYGGWVAPNIYYLGYAGVVQFGGVRIGGLSGIYKGHDYNKGHYERPPYTEETKRSAYHIRNVDVFRVKQISRPIDIFLSHDWPSGVWDYGDVNYLLRKKPFFRDDIEKGVLGSRPAQEVLHKIQPEYWFSAHLHVKFAALVEHKSESNERTTKSTKFLSLDKCLPRRQFLQIVDVPHDPDKKLKLELDPEWLVILKSTNHLLNISKRTQYMPGPGSSERWDFTATDEQIKTIKEDFGEDLSIPENFETTAAIHRADSIASNRVEPPELLINPQTTLICQMLELVYPNAAFKGTSELPHLDLDASVTTNPDEISLDDNDSGSDEQDDVDTSSCLTPARPTDTSSCLTPDTSHKDVSSASKLTFPDLNSSVKSNKEAVISFEGIDELEKSGSEADKNGSQAELNPDKTGSDSPLQKEAAIIEDSNKDTTTEEKSENKTSDSSPKPKKFKRRNQSVYEEKDDS